MNQKKLPFLIIAASLSMIALIAIQVYWIKTSARTQQKKFDQTVMEVMRSVSEKLEKEEAVTTVTSRLFNDLTNDLPSDSAVTLEQFPLNDPFQKQIITKENKLNSNNKQGDQLKIQFSKPPEDSSLLIIRKTQKRVLSSNISFRNQLQKKATLVNEIVNELALISINRNFDKNVTYDHIDSLFARELHSAGINTEYIFDVQDSDSELLTFTEEDYLEEKLINSPYKLSLFPNDFYLDSDNLILYFPNQDSFLLRNSWKVLSLSILLVLILIGLFYSSLSTIFKQKKLSQVKNDFINNMTHELKTPISTISLACEALSDNSISIDPDRRNNYVGMITDENKRLSILVDNVLKSAVWDSAKLKLKEEEIDLHTILRKVARSFEIQLNKKGGKLTLDLQAKAFPIVGDRVHLSNVIYNLLDNANKYSSEEPEINISTKEENDSLLLIVKDHGIGISKEDQRKIFDKFYRVSTGNIHNVKGFGLGLSYVKRVVEMHGGEINLQSELKKGTTIIIKFKNYGK